MNFLFVFLGGGMGALLRYSISKLIPYQNGFPWSTFVANLISCALLGFILSMLQEKEGSEKMLLFMATGICGGFSTFSTFSAETFTLLEKGDLITAFSYVLLSVFAGLLCFWIGMKMT